MALRFASVREIHLQYVAGSSAKEYRVTLDDESLTVTCSWGRIGNVVNSQVFACATLADAQQLAVAKVNGKLDKGYATVAERHLGGVLVHFAGAR